ncbi:hypothetical protein KGQ29_04815, partial [Patescibacteria group bacterium]|nr:hypothetical protein [Patescibacteria group bacterium]
YAVPQIAKILRREEDTVRDRLNSFVSIRVANIFHKYDDNENASKLTKEQKEEIKTTLAKPPSDISIPKEFWSLPAIKEYVSAKFALFMNRREAIIIFLNASVCLGSFPAPLI